MEVGVADAGIGNLDGHIIGADCAAGELVWRQVSAVVLSCPADGVASALDRCACLLQSCRHISKRHLVCSQALM